MKLNYTPYDTGKPTAIDKIYKNGDERLKLEFVDVSGKLKELIEFEVNVLAKSSHWLEGITWIKDKTKGNGGYIIVTEPYEEENIWSFDPSIKDKKQRFKHEQKMQYCGPAATAWTEKYPDELYVACFVGQSIVSLNLTDWNRVGSMNFGEDQYASYTLQPCDVAADIDGNIYFTELPFARLPDQLDYEDPHTSLKGGIYRIDKETLDVEMIDELEYGPNGISISPDGDFMVAANFFDVPINEWDSQNFKQHNWDNIYVNGYRKDADGKFKERVRYFSSNKEPVNKYVIPTEDGVDMAFERNGFDKYGNLWQCMYFNDGALGSQISILRNKDLLDGEGDDEIEYIGHIRVKNRVYSPNNLAMGDDGYMYITTGSFSDDNTKGGLMRIKFKDEKEKDNNQSNMNEDKKTEL